MVNKVDLTLQTYFNSVIQVSFRLLGTEEIINSSYKDILLFLGENFSI